VRPEDITLNIGKGVPLPVPNMPGQWKAVTHDNTVTWLANWTENINGNHKYVFLAAGSSLKGQSDMQKFEKARELKVCYIRLSDYLSFVNSVCRTTLIAFVKTIMLICGLKSWQIVNVLLLCISSIN